MNNATEFCKRWNHVILNTSRRFRARARIALRSEYGVTLDMMRELNVIELHDGSVIQPASSTKQLWKPVQ